MQEKIYLGTSSDYGRVYLNKHTWDCGWYWGFGYLGNASCHFHFDSYLGKGSDNQNVTKPRVAFDKSTWISNDQWWILRDLFTQAYALKEAADVYRHGGHQTATAAEYRIIDLNKAAMINEDLGLLLDRIWILVNEWKDNYKPNKKAEA